MIKLTVNGFDIEIDTADENMSLKVLDASGKELSNNSYVQSLEGEGNMDDFESPKIDDETVELDDENDLRFKTFINQDLSAKIQDPGGFGTRVSFSTNPIDFDEKYWLVIIHQIKFQITGRCYYHWAVLIDKETKLPVKMTSKPIFSGMGARGRVPGYRYISSVLKRGDELLFFAGEGDIYVTVTKKKIKEIENLLVNI